MKRYYLHLFNSAGSAPDEEGKELPSLEAARELALLSIRDLLSEEAKVRGRIEIADETGQLLATVHFPEAFELHLEGAGQ
jgi:hypothetical protein